MLYGIDLDDTLINSYMTDLDKKYHLWRLLPNRRERIHEIRAKGHAIAIITNQGGIGAGHVTSGDFVWKVYRVLAELNLIDFHALPAREGPDWLPPLTAYPNCPDRVSIHVASAKHAATDTENRRKPNPTMLIEAQERWPEHAKEGMLMIGDHSDDHRAAVAAGVEFVIADEFFCANPAGWPIPERVLPVARRVILLPDDPYLDFQVDE